MGDRDRATLAKARKELEEMYLGIPDDSVNLTFQDLAQVRQHHAEKKKSSSPSQPMDPISESSPRESQKNPSPDLAKLPSLDFSKGLEASFQSTTDDHHLNFNYFQNHRNLHNHPLEESDLRSPRGRNYVHEHHLRTGDHGRTHHHHDGNPHAKVHGHHHHHLDGSLNGGIHGHGHHHHGGGDHGITGSMRHDQMSMVCDDMSHMSGMSMAYGSGRSRRRRLGIPHSNICAICCNYIYVFRHRCLVCGRVYCRQCVSIGMGEMTEGRKCIECLGRRFSARYIHKAGNMGCCMGYSSIVKQQEFMWAEKGPRRSGENRHGQSVISTVAPGTPHRQHSPASNPPSFVMNSPYSPYSPSNHHPLPF